MSILTSGSAPGGLSWRSNSAVITIQFFTVYHYPDP
jgi:hypothetical protein